MASPQNFYQWVYSTVYETHHCGRKCNNRTVEIPGGGRGTFSPITSKKMVVQCAPRRGTHNQLKHCWNWKGENFGSRAPAHRDPMPEEKQSLPACPPTWSPTAQKSSFRACHVGVVSAGSVRGARGTSSEALGSLPNTHTLTRGKQRPLPEEGTQSQAPVFSPAPHGLLQSSQLPCRSPPSLPCQATSRWDSWPALFLCTEHASPPLAHTPVSR